ncbi:MAG: BamA/TamA family outer membrane protein [Ginsengibacter sp.]
MDDSKNHIDQESVLRARLLDMMIGDWDRHFDQWRFGTNDTGAGKLYYPIPRDRDQAYFNSDGLFVRSLSLAVLPYLQGFKKHYYNIKWFNWEERNFDRLFMNNLDENAWRRIIKTFQQNETDSVINEAVKQLPPQIYELDKKTIPAKLKSRRNLLSTAGLKYYRFLSKEVNILGSNVNEYFKLFNAGDDLEVKVYKVKKKNADTSDVIFDRIFKYKDTKFINLYGLNGNDNFEIDSTANSKIKVRIIGGRGIDTFNIKGNVKNKIFDYAPDSNYIENLYKSSVVISSDPQINNYDLTGYNYNSYRLPLISIGFNEEDKFIAGLGYSYKTYAFRKLPYSTFQRVTSLFSLNTGAYQAKYNGEFNQRISKYDVLVRGDIHNTVLNNFYGLGNETKKNNDLSPSFYNVRYSYVSGEVLLRKRFHSLAEINLGPTYYHYWNHHQGNDGRILEHPGNIGLDSASIYNNKSYAGAKASIVIHNTNSEFLPTRGVLFSTELTSLVGLNDDSRQLTKLTADMTLNASFTEPTRLVMVLRGGYGHIFNNNYEYFQALTLGSNSHLRGFRKDRFAGKSVLYGSFEARYKIFASQSYIIPGDVGMLGFFDAGRVWVKDGTSHKWHHSYGAGLYYSPYNFAIVSATVGFSEEGSLFNFSLGTKFNITF